MKNKLLLFFLMGCLIPSLGRAQCAISKETLDDGVVSYDGDNISIYKNEDFENGIQAAYLQMIVMQKGSSSNLLQFVVHISVYHLEGNQ